MSNSVCHGSIVSDYVERSSCLNELLLRLPSRWVVRSLPNSPSITAHLAAFICLILATDAQALNVPISDPRFTEIRDVNRQFGTLIPALQCDTIFTLKMQYTRKPQPTSKASTFALSIWCARQKFQVSGVRLYTWWQFLASTYSQWRNAWSGVAAVVNKGQTVTDYWRVVNQRGGYTWLQSRATLVCNAKSLDDQRLIVINYVIRYASYVGGR